VPAPLVVNLVDYGSTLNLDGVVLAFPAILVEPFERERNRRALAGREVDIYKVDADRRSFRARIGAMKPLIAAPMEHESSGSLNPQGHTRSHRTHPAVEFPYSDRRLRELNQTPGHQLGNEAV